MSSECGVRSAESPVRCVAFDLDGTLVDSFPALRRAYDSFLQSFGHSGSDEEFARLNGPSMNTVVALLKSWRELQGGEADLLAEYHRHVGRIYRDGIPAMPGAEALLDLAKRLGCKRALVTSSPRKVVDDVLAGLGWSGMFDALACGDEVAESKPAPDLYRLVCRRGEWDPCRCLAIEDAEAGVRSAKAAGMRVIAVETTMPPDRLQAAGADWVCRTLAEAGRVLREEGAGSGLGLAR